MKPSKIDPKRMLLPGAIFILAAGLAILSLTWQEQIKDLKRQKSENEAKISELQKKVAANTSQKSTSDSSSKTYLEIESWGLKFDNDQNLTYVIDKFDGHDRLLLTTSKLKSLITDECPGVGSEAIYPVSIIRSRTELAQSEGVEFMESLGTFNGYLLYLSYSKEPCSKDSSEPNQRLQIYDAAKTIQKL